MKKLCLGIGVVVLIISLFGCNNVYRLTNEEIIKAQSNFIDAFEQSEQMTDYSAEIKVSIIKEAFFTDIGMTIAGTIHCTSEECQGLVTLDIPQNKRTCTYWSGSSTSEIAKLYLSESTALDLPFNMVNIGKGIVVELPKEIVEKGVPTSSALVDLRVSLSNEEVYQIYGDMIDYFILVAEAMTLDITEMTFTSATLSISFTDGVITSYSCSMKADTNMGEIKCEFVENILR